MNRLSTTNFMLDLTADVKVDRKDSLAILHLPNEVRIPLPRFALAACLPAPIVTRLHVLW